jgi:hypothetical protein
MPTKTNWEVIKREYVEGIANSNGELRFPSLDELTKKYQCSYSTLTKRSSSDNWTTEQKLYRRKLEDSRQNKKIEYLASESAEFNAKILRLAGATLSHCARHLQESATNGKVMPLLELTRLAQIIERMAKTGNIALGENVSEDTESPLKTLADKLIDKMSNETPIT